MTNIFLEHHHHESEVTQGGGGGANRWSKRGGDQGGGRGEQRPWRIFGGGRGIGGRTEEDSDWSEEDLRQEQGGS